MKRACVIGWPISHSLSPVIHGYWMREHGIDGEYRKVAVPPEDLRRFILGMRANGLCGCNVTVPHKIEAYHLCDRLDAAARAVEAVNTLWFDGDALAGSNTDATGFAINLDREAPGWDAGRSSAAVIGAGGAARAILWALRERGFEDVRIVNRTAGRAAELARSFPRGRAFGLADANEALLGAGLLVNTSTLGMTGAPQLDLDLSPMPSDAVVCDIVYHPLETALLRRARERGLVAVDGLGMLLHQAVPGFETWFGVRPNVTPGLRAAVLEAIAEREKERP